MRNRLDRKRGRFTMDFEVNEIHGALTAYQGQVGTTVDYYRYDGAKTQVNDIYDEGFGQGLAWKDPFPLPVISATHQEGSREDRAEGFYTNDEVHLTAGFDQIRRAGLSRLDLDYRNYLKDRFVYDQTVFRVTNIQVLGQVNDRDVIVGIDGTEVKPDELVNDAQFKHYSA